MLEARREGDGKATQAREKRRSSRPPCRDENEDIKSAPNCFLDKPKFSSTPRDAAVVDREIKDGGTLR
jgi:hypothetical protein